MLEQDATTTAVDLDQVFNTLDPATRRDLQKVIKGSAAQHDGRGDQMNAGLLYLNPSLQASSRLFRELNSDSKLLERFVVSSSELVTDLADRHDDLAGLVDNLADDDERDRLRAAGAGGVRASGCPPSCAAPTRRS